MFSSNMNLVLAVGAGVCIGYIAAYIRNSKQAEAGKEKRFRDRYAILRNRGDEYKMVLVVRNDLHMGKGKACAQCAHGATGMYKKMTDEQNHELIERWFDSGQKKVVVKVDSSEELHAIREKAGALGVPTEGVRDAGLTQIAPGSETVLCLGPATSQIIDEITGHLRLY